MKPRYDVWDSLGVSEHVFSSLNSILNRENVLINQWIWGEFVAADAGRYVQGLSCFSLSMISHGIWMHTGQKDTNGW